MLFRMKNFCLGLVLVSFLGGQVAFAYAQPEPRFKRMHAWAEKLSEKIAEKYEDSSDAKKLKMVKRSLKRLEKNIARLESKTQAELNEALRAALAKTQAPLSLSASELDLDEEELALISDVPALTNEEVSEVSNSVSIDRNATLEHMKHAVSVLKAEKAKLEGTEASFRGPASVSVRFISASIFLGISVTFVVTGGVFAALVFGVSFLILGVCGIAVAVSLFALAARR